ncbi:metalloregulator ArsR/SmtB family transcription factor [candidate division KSB1 bacterium]|nr:metalloregulator ArsR/SmtB family transcription factor [candidate division KSB1 bacterium]
MTTSRELKDRLFTQFARIGSALASPKRLELLDLLVQCEKDVETLAAGSGMSVANTSHHLQALHGAALVESRKDGVRVIYRIAGNRVAPLFRNLQQLAETQLGEVERIVKLLNQEDGALAPMDRKELLKLAKTGQVTVLDVRPEDEYRAAHLPHAISVPLPKLRSYLSHLPKTQAIVAYCRGPYCVLAGEAVRLLRAKGFHASRIRDGVAEWQEAGMSIVADSNPPRPSSVPRPR